MRKKVVDSGRVIFTEIEESSCKLIFNPPLLFDYWVYEDKKAVAYIEFDFGMTVKIAADQDSNFFIWGKNNSYEEIIKETIKFDLFHAFTHVNFDPNYTAYHWALLGWLKERTKIYEK